MMQKLYTKKQATVYQLDFTIVKTAYKPIAAYNLNTTQLNEPWVMDEDCSVSIDKIAISDAFTHKERLVFPAFWIKNTVTGERKVCWVLSQIDGRWTYLSAGGDSRTMHRPEIYARHLRGLQ